MRGSYKIFAVGLLSFFIAACSLNRDPKVVSSPQKQPETIIPKQDLIVLLPEPGGKVGVIRVENAGGSQILDKPWQTARIEDYRKPPTPTQTADEKEIADIFRSALEAQPDLTRRFASFTLWFESDKTRLTEASKAMLPEVLRTIKSRHANEIHIVGHTDRVGTDSHNLKLSAKRAGYVRNLLFSGGVKTNAFVVSFQGEAMPLVNTEDEVAEPLNRRVEIFIR
jgi:outer membrane protein OmpA-like peptidoglycan-associated protein